MAQIARRCGLMAVLVLLSYRDLPAADLAKDPVEEFRAALEDFPSPFDPSPARTQKELDEIIKAWHARVKTWEKRITLAAEAIKPLDDQCRAVLLEELWPTRLTEDRDKVTSPIRKALFERFAKSARDVIAKGDATRRTAVLILIARSAKTEQKPDRASNSEDFFLTFKEDCTNLLKGERDSRARIAALRALPYLLTKSVEAAPLLKSGLKETAPVAERRAAAAVLGAFLDFRPIPRPTPRPPGFPGEAKREKGPTQLSRWKEQSESLLPMTGHGMKDADPTVRRLSLAALSSAVQELSQSVRFLREELVAQTMPYKQPGRVDSLDEATLAEFRPSLQSCLEALNREFVNASAALRDGDLSLCLAAHKVIEDGATLRHTLRTEKWFATATKEKKHPFDEPVKAVPALAQSLKHGELRVRLAALYALETLTVDAAPAAAALAAALKDDNRYVRWGAARAIRNMAPAGADQKVVTALTQVLADESPEVRNTAALALVRYGPAAKDAVAALSKAVKIGDQKMRLLSARALGAIGKEAQSAEPELAAALADERPTIRAAAAMALGRQGTLKKETRAALTAAVNDADADVRRAAAGALLGE